MDLSRFRRVTGVLLISGAVLVNIPYTLLILNFGYPDILRSPVSEILLAFADGGARLVFTWMAFAWIGVLILLGVLRLPRALDDESQTGKTALVAGVIGLVAQLIGLLRWTLVVPGLAQVYSNPAASNAAKTAAEVAFDAVHRYGGVVIGEHIGQIFTILWMVLLSVALLRSRALPRWVPISGIVGATIYALAQGELLATVVPGFPNWGPAGLLGSLLWLGWLVVIGIKLLRTERNSS